MPRKTHLDPKLKEILDNIDLNEGDNALIDETVVDEEAAYRLRTLYERLTNHRENALHPGQLAMWKPGLKNRRFPAYGQPAIVVERLDPPILDHEEEAGVTYYREPLDMLLGVLHKDGDFLIYHFDSRRFQIYEESGTVSRSSS
ncbi:MAG: hypothetical protein IPL59_18675 [Candidatus Competibacteraceae bacterium]|nr:hypothetical protein [Candidatus Competibacteraceae bacterium]MBK8751619.1 hypothetical protein [Candidatus Competibacteraceae bacterium]